MRKTEDIAFDLLTGVIVNGGATVPAFHGQRQPRSGYVVAVPGHEYRTNPDRWDTEEQEEELQLWTSEHRASLAWYGYAGSWRDGDSIVLDVVQVIGERAAAVALGRQRGEEAIFDLANGETIYV